MKTVRKILFVLVLTSLLAAACGAKAPSELPTPQVKITQAPPVDQLAADYLAAWQKEDYAAMYAMLSSASKSALTEEEFLAVYEEANNNLSLISLAGTIKNIVTDPATAQATCAVTFTTALFGDLQREAVVRFVFENGNWKVGWDKGAILTELASGNSLRLDVQSPARGNIYDRNGLPLVQETKAYALGIIPNQIGEGREGQLLFQLSELTGRTQESISAQYASIRGTDWYVPVGEASADEVNERWNTLINLGGLIMTEFTARYYYGGGTAPQAIGFTQPIAKEDIVAYRRQGYVGDEKVGQAGLEKYAESILAGKPSASLYIVDAAGQIVTRLAQSDPRPAQNITTTIDKNLQLEAQKAIQGFKGAVVVMEVDTGRVLAMASSPGFDPNLFSTGNRNSAELLSDTLNDGQNRLLNRAAQSSYPLGSVFKIIDMAAALESGLYTPETRYYCGYYFEELPGEKFEDWTLKKEYPESGELTLSQGLMRSCNPWFYHIGLDLFRKKGATYLADMARAFGLGSATGIEQVAEDTGQIVDPKSDGDAVQQGIGQGEMLVTPLQVARFTAALGNDGTLYKPQMIESITSTTGVTVFTFTPVEDGQLPISPENMAAIQDAMRGVVRAKIGTAVLAFEGLSIPVYGKTGTATNSTNESHAWFTGYTNTNREDKVDIAVTVIVENAGEGSEVAAPIMRRVVEVYYYGEPVRRYPWESKFNVTRTPTLQYTLTPTPTPIRPEPSEPEATPTPAG